MTPSITLLASNKGKHICATAPRVDTYRIENNDNARNVSLAFIRIGAGLFAPAPYAFEVWSDDADSSGKGLYVEGGLSIAGNKLEDYDGGFRKLGAEFFRASQRRSLLDLNNHQQRKPGGATRLSTTRSDGVS